MLPDMGNPHTVQHGYLDTEGDETEEDGEAEDDSDDALYTSL